jgi:hypothetical protein
LGKGKEGLVVDGRDIPPRRDLSGVSEEACIAKRVRAREGVCLRSALLTSVGMIEKRWGDPDYAALDVLFDDGSKQLFWHHELEEVDDEG